MSNAREIKLPEVKLVKGGKVLTTEEAQALSTQIQWPTYEYAGAIWSIGCDPNAIESVDEDRIQAIQFEMASISELKDKVIASKGKATDKDALDLISSIDSSTLKKMLAKQKEYENAEIDMLVKAVVGCNDPAHPVTAESLKKGGMVAKLQLEALKNWWNPTVPPSEAETNETKTQKSSS